MKWGWAASIGLSGDDPDQVSDVATLEYDYYDAVEDEKYQSKRKKERSSDFFRNQRMLYNERTKGDFNWSVGKSLNERFRCMDCFV